MRSHPQRIVLTAVNPPSNVMSASLQLLGGARILDSEGVPLQGRAAHRRRLAVLAVLGAARGRAVPRERLVSLLWPDVRAADARHSLVESLSVIRRELGVDPFDCVGDEVALLLDRLACDVDQLEHALAEGDGERAMRLYTGPFLDGLTVHGAPEFERWAEEERGRLAAVLARGLEAYASQREGEEGSADVREAWGRLYALDPYRTRVALRLSDALEAAGDPGAALRHLQGHETLLRRDLELPAPADLVAAIDRLRVTPARVAAAVRNASPGPRAACATAWVAQWVGEAVRADGGAVLRSQARRAALRAGGTVQGWVGDGVRAQFEGPAAAVAAALSLLRVCEERRGASSSEAVAIGLGDGAVDEEGTGEPDLAVLRASVALTLARPGTIAMPARLARQVGRIPAAETADAGHVLLPDSAEPEEMVWVTPFRRARAAEAEVPAAPLLPSPPPPSDAPVRSRRRTGAAILVAAGALALTFLMARGLSPSAPPDESSPAGETLRLAVLGCRPGTDALTARCEGLMDLVAVELAQVSGIDVVRPFSGPDGRPFWPADALEQGALPGSPGLRAVQGRLERTGGRLRQILFLSDPARGGRILAADTMYVGDADGDRLAERLPGRMARLLRREYGREIDMGSAPGTRNVNARSLYLRARVLRYGAQDSLATGDPVRVRLGLADLSRADTLLARAEAADPGWLEPVVERVIDALLVGGASPMTTREASYRAAARNASHAVRLAPRSPAAHEALGRALWELTSLAAYADSGAVLIRRAELELEEALRLDEERASTLYLLSEIRYYRGDFSGSYALAVRGYRADPYLRGRIMLARRYYRALLSMGEYARAEEACRQGAEDFPDDLRFMECPLELMARGWGDANPAAADSLRNRLLRHAGPGEANGLDYQPFHWSTQYAAVLARAGRAEEARMLLEAARAAVREEMERVRRAGADGEDLWMSFLFDEAQVRVQLGETAAARRALDELSVQRPYYRDYVRSDHLFRSVF